MKLRNSALFYPAVFLSLAAFAASAEDRALLVGINAYQAVKGLKGTHNDVLAMREMLTKQLGFSDAAIRELKDEAATKAGILTAIDTWLVQDSKPGDRIVFYYSGHGDQISDQSGDESDGEDEALIPHDAQAGGENWLLDDDISERMQQLAGREVLAVFDSCHSGSVTRGAFDDEDAKIPEWPDKGSAMRGAPLDTVHQKEGGFIDGGGNTAAFFAVAPNQLASEDRKSEPQRPHGVFTDALVRGVAGEADANHDAQVSFAELLEFTRERSERYCKTFKKNCNNSPLTPLLEIDASRQAGDIRAFGRPASSPARLNAAQVAAAVLPHGNAAGLQLRMAPENRVGLGASVRYELQTQHPGKLAIFDIAPSHKMTQLFPNAYIPRNTPKPCQATLATGLVGAGLTILIPDNCMGFNFVAQEPLGKGKIVAVLIEDAAIDSGDLLATAAGESTFTAIGNPEAWLAQLRTRLDQVFHEQDGRNRAVRWSVTSIDYEIVP